MNPTVISSVALIFIMFWISPLGITFKTGLIRSLPTSTSSDSSWNMKKIFGESSSDTMYWEKVRKSVCKQPCSGSFNGAGLSRAASTCSSMKSLELESHDSEPILRILGVEQSVSSSSPSAVMAARERFLVGTAGASMVATMQ